MAYNLSLTNGQNLVTVADGTTDTNFTSLTLVGKNFAGYGAFLNENFIKLLENFSNNSAPPNPLQGQVWWDSTNKILKIYSGSVWKTVSSSTAAGIPPSTPIIGDLWWDTTNGQLKVWGGTQWVVIGPAYTATQGQTGVMADVVSETGGGQSHIIVKFYVNNQVVAVLSKDPSFTAAGLTGFTTINPGFNLSSVGSLGYYGNANNALNLGGIAASNYLRADQASTTLFPLTVQHNSGLNVGATGDFNVGVTSTAVNLAGQSLGKDLNLYVNLGGIQTKLLALNATNGAVTVAADPNLPLGIATKQYVDGALSGSTSPILMRDGTNSITGNILPGANAVYNLGSASSVFNNVYSVAFVGTATNSLALGGVAASSYMRNDVQTPITSPVSIVNNNGLTIGASGDFTINVTSSPNAVNLKGNTSGKGLNVSVNVGGNQTTALAIDGTSGLVTVLGAPTDPLGIATKQYVTDQIAGGGINLGSVTGNIIPSQNNVYNIGSTLAKWNTVHATTFAGNASTANYADLAERFSSDQQYQPGTVVELGGVAEITAVVDDLSDNVFGVVSTKAAYLMNASAGTDHSHPPIAMQGRVPVRVIGQIRKGDRLVSAGRGLARAASRSEITAFNVIGRSLEDKQSTVEGSVEAIVKLCS